MNQNYENTNSKPQILILGTYHFGKGGDHVVSAEIADVLSPQKQVEISQVIDCLEKFRPTKIAVEAAVGRSKELNELYSEYCLKKLDLNSDVISHRTEIIQLGFRLAARLNHSKIYPIDFPAGLPFESAIDLAKVQYPNFYDEFFAEIKSLEDKMTELQRNATVIEILRYLNDKNRAYNEHSNTYLNFAKIGAGDGYEGANFLSIWYDRNIRIFGNLSSIVSPNDRILVIYGAGHITILNHLISSYSSMELVSPFEYI